MRIVKFVLLFVVLVIVSGGIYVYVYYNRIPKIDPGTSVLILGKGGEGHTAPNLTDTIMLASLNEASKKVTLLSLPRDIWISEIRAKLNTAYHYGGFKMAGDSVKSVTGQNVKYTVVVDFTLFRDLIDSMGGINVNVDNSFIDERYPIAGKENDLCEGDTTYACRYEKLDIKSGMQKMDGETALKFVRSRNADGDEGTDIAREKRQQKVIEALKVKLLSNKVILSPKTLEKLYIILISHIETDIDTSTAISIAKFLYESRSNINFLSIPEDLLSISQNDRKYDRQYVFIPKSGSWKELQEWIKSSI